MDEPILSLELEARSQKLKHRLKLSQYTILALVAICAPFGDSCLARGMRTLPPISLAHPFALITSVFTPWIAAGIALLICFFACYLTALSWADLTYVLPTTAFGYVIIALLGRFWLQEQISPYRWAGILLITLGVGFVAQGPAVTEKQDAVDAPVAAARLDTSQ